MSMGEIGHRVMAIQDQLAAEVVGPMQHAMELLDQAVTIMANAVEGSGQDDALSLPAQFKVPLDNLRETAASFPAIAEALGSISIRLCGSRSSADLVSVPHFLSVGQTADALGVNTETLRSIYARLQHLVLPSSTRLFPDTYINSFLASEQWQKGSQVGRRATAYAQSDDAREVVLYTEAAYAAEAHRMGQESQIKDTLSTSQITALLGIDRSTWKRWHAAGKLDGTGIIKEQHTDSIRIPVSSLLSIVSKWHRPKGLQ